MTNSRQLAIEAVRGFKAGLQTRLDSWPAFTGDGRGNLRNSDSDSQYMLVRWPLATSPAVEVLNDFIPDVENLRVMVGYTADQPDVLRILSRADSRADNVPFVGVMNHAAQHGYLAPDMDWVDFRRVLSFRVIPYSGLNVFVYGGVLPVGGSFVNVENQVVDLTASVPVSGARYAAISVATDGTITVTDGSTQPTAQALTVSNVPAVPSGEFRLAAVLLRAGQTSITETLAQNDLLDLRWPQAHLESSISPSSVALTDSHIIVGNASNVGADVAMSGDATIANTGVITFGSVNSNAGSFTYASLTVNAKGLITAASSGTAPITGSGTPGRVAQFATASTLGDSNLIGSGAGVLTLSAAGTYTLTVPATGTAALVGIDNTFVSQTIKATLTVLGDSGVEPNVKYIPIGGGSTARYLMGISGAGSFQFQSTDSGTPRSFAVVSSGGASKFTVAFDTGNTVASGTLQSDVATHTGTTNAMLVLNTTNAACFINFNENSARNWAMGHDGGLVTNGFFLYDSPAAKTPFKVWPASVENTLTLYQGKVGIGVAQASVPLQVALDNATTNAVDTLLTLAHNSTGTAAAGFGLRKNYTLESSTTADQVAGYEDRLWTDATHASRTALYRGTTTGNATQTGFYGAWAHNAVSNTAITIIPNGTGDVASVGTFLFSVKDNTAGTTNGGVVVLNPGGGAISLLSDGTDTVQITCAADGSVTIARSAGTHTFAVSIWGTWQ